MSARKSHFHAIESTARIGLVPGKDFDPGTLSALDQERIKSVPKVVLLKMMHRVQEQTVINGWLCFQSGVGDWGTDYLLRATTAWLGPGWNRVEDEVYPISMTDSLGDGSDGAAHQYTLHFATGQFPPSKGFWSLTMYDKENFLAQNALDDRYSLSQRDKLIRNSAVSAHAKAELAKSEHAIDPRRNLETA